MKEASACGVRYIIDHPQDFKQGEKYPLLILLHGAGGRGDDIEVLKNNPFYRFARLQELPFVTVAPLCEENTWFDMWERLTAFIKQMAGSEFIDKMRVYLMGASMGGYATWQMAMSIPECFAAIVPICGGGMYWNASRLKNVPVWAFHGAKDTTVLLEESEKMVNAVNRKGGDARLTVYPENGHDAWSDTYSDTKVFRWLLEQKNKCLEWGGDEYNDPKKFG